MLSATRMGLAAGILWGLTMFVFTIISYYTGYGDDFFGLFESIYPYYDISIGGAFIGLIEGFIDGFICLFLLIWLYNQLERYNLTLNRK